mmetsp:Transcript_28130/g.67574  ORF Transcript_28130/g.67574 Transcript_28130/m.67574 type:complete len:246 (+) Transcript_28130:248-985(+)
MPLEFATLTDLVTTLKPIQGRSNVLPVRELPEHVHLPPQASQQLLPLRALGQLQHLLYDEVGVLVAHHLQQRGRGIRFSSHDGPDEAAALFVRAAQDGPLHNVGRELVRRQGHHVLTNAVHQCNTILRSLRVLQHVLHDVVAKLVPSQLVEAVHHSLEDAGDLLRGAVLNQALQDSAPVRLHGHALHVLMHGMNDKINVPHRHHLDALLDHVAPVLVLDALHHVVGQFLGQGDLLGQGHGLQSLL